MTKTQFADLHTILAGLDRNITGLKTKVTQFEKNTKTRLDSFEKDMNVLASKAEAFEEQFQKINKAMANVQLVTIETQNQTRQIHSNMISTADKQGQEIRRLKLVRGNNGEPSSGGRRPARKNT